VQVYGRRKTCRPTQPALHPNVEMGKLFNHRSLEDCEPWPQKPTLLDEALSPWINYRGLWRFRTLAKDESVPPGPRWNRQQDRN